MIRLLLILSILCGSWTVAFSEPLTHAPTGIVFPDELEGFARIGYQEFPMAQYGVSYAYRTEKGDHATIYIYNAGLEKIPDDITDPIIIQHHEQVLSEVFQFAEMKGRSVEHLLPDKTVTFSGNQKEVQVLLDGFIIRPPATFTELFLWPARGYFFKIRMTPGDSSDSGTEHRKAFCEAVVRLSQP